MDAEHGSCVVNAYAYSARTRLLNFIQCLSLISGVNATKTQANTTTEIGNEWLTIYIEFDL